MENKPHLAIRLAFHIIGIIILAFGIVLTIYSDLGASPMPALNVAMAQNFGLTVGTWEYIFGALFIVIIAIVRKEKPDFLAFLTSFIAGVFIDLWLFTVKFIYIPEILLGKVLFMILGLLCLGLGVSIYLQGKLSPSPPDGMMLLIHEYGKIKLSTARTIFSVILVVIAFILGGPISIGTIIITFGLGPVIGLFFPRMENLFVKCNKKFISKKEELDDTSLEELDSTSPEQLDKTSSI